MPKWSNASFVGVRYDIRENDTVWQCVSGNGDAGAVSNISTGIVASKNTEYNLSVSYIYNSQLTCIVNNAFVTKTTNLPTTSDNIFILNLAKALNPSPVKYAVSYVYFEDN